VLSAADTSLAEAAGDPARRLSVTVVGGAVQVLDGEGKVIVAEARPARLGGAWRQPRVTVDLPGIAVDAEFDSSNEAVALALSLAPGEGLYGWGEWFQAFRRERGEVRLRTRDANYYIQQRATYSALPVYISSRGYAFWLLNSHESVWTLAPERGVLEVTAAGPPADYVVIHGPGLREIIATYTALTGRPPLVPRWALGLMVTGYPQEHQSVVIERVAEHRRRGIPLDAVILDYHWEERFHNFRWRPALVPNPDGLIRTLRAEGVRLGLIFTPFVNHRNRTAQRRLLNMVAKNTPAGMENDDLRALPEYRQALEKGYLAHPNARWWFGAGGMVDFSNPAAAGWWNEHLRPLYAQGVAFFKNDDGEYLPRDARSALGMDGREYHNLYGFYYGRAIYDGMLALDDRRPFIYARSVWVGSQRYPALFLGDQKPTFDHIRSTLRAGLNLGLLGFAHWTADVFGLDGTTTPELHRRHAQYALLAPIARYFWRPPGVDGTRLPWSHGPENEANFRAHAELRYRLLPYYAQLGWEAYQTGLPVLRPLLLHFPDDPRLADVADQALLGEALMLAPVLAAGDPTTGVAQRRILLPAGATWHDFWSELTFPGGGEIDYSAPPDRLPLLVRGGTVLPMGPPLSFVPDDHQFEALELLCWPPYPARLLFYDDDGRTRAYQRGAFSTMEVRVQQQGEVVTVEIGAGAGGFAEQATERRLTIILQRVPAAPASVGAEGPGGARDIEWRYDAERRALRVAFTQPVAEATRLNISLSK
jgi:alpha-glucosidase (family GH31 glycosyl hydrolase)